MIEAPFLCPILGGDVTLTFGMTVGCLMRGVVSSSEVAVPSVVMVTAEPCHTSLHAVLERILTTNAGNTERVEDVLHPVRDKWKESFTCDFNRTSHCLGTTIRFIFYSLPFPSRSFLSNLLVRTFYISEISMQSVYTLIGPYPTGPIRRYFWSVILVVEI